MWAGAVGMQDGSGFAVKGWIMKGMGCGAYKAVEEVE